MPSHGSDIITAAAVSSPLRDADGQSLEGAHALPPPPVNISSLNLLTDAWLPVRRASGPALICPAQVTDRLDDDPVLAPDWPRPDFRIATIEFLVGLLATACPPADHDAWLAHWQEPPRPEDLEAAFAPLARAFVLDGDGPRFLQDLEDFPVDSEPIERLLIEAPGASTTSKNTDLLVKRDRVATLARATAAIALYTFQSWAPAGGAGNRTGLRGGGPLVTFVAPQPRRTLWHLLWANVPISRPPANSDLPRVFPWLAPTLTSEGTRIVTPEDNAHPLQAFWGMPRRIRLDFAKRHGPVPCGLTGAPDPIQVTGWRQRPRGANYAKWGRRHPLTPHYRARDGEWLPMHPQPGGIGYRHWLGLVVEAPDGSSMPAAAVATWRSERRRDARSDSRLVAAGYDMDNMKARAFVESEMPLPVVPDGEAQKRLDALAAALVQASETAAGLLRSAVRAALFAPGATVKPDVELLASVRERLWERTETAFFTALETAARRGGAEGREEIEPEREEWIKRLRTIALALFDEAAPLSPEVGGSAAARLAKARRSLMFALSGYGRDGKALFERLGVPPPQPKSAEEVFP